MILTGKDFAPYEPYERGSGGTLVDAEVKARAAYERARQDEADSREAWSAQGLTHGEATFEQRRPLFRAEYLYRVADHLKDQWYALHYLVEHPAEQCGKCGELTWQYKQEAWRDVMQCRLCGERKLLCSTGD